MKGTYDDGKMEFYLAVQKVRPKQENIELVGEYKYEDVDGWSIDSFFHNGRGNKGQIVLGFGRKADMVDGTKGWQTGGYFTPVDVPEDDQSLDYVIANGLVKEYQTLPTEFKRAALCFLERHVVDYDQVREFVQTGKNFLEGVDPYFGISAQGTAKPKGRR